MKHSFGKKLTFYFISIILLTSISLGVITYGFFYNSLKEKALTESKEQIHYVNNYISNVLQDYKNDCKFLSNNPQIKQADSTILPLFKDTSNVGKKKYSEKIKGIESSIYRQFYNYANSDKNVAYVYMGTKWGGYVQWPDGLTINSYDPRNRPWYKQSASNPNKVLLSSPYVAQNEAKSIIVSITSAVHDNSNNFIGVCGIDLSLNTLSKIVDNLKPGDEGYVFIFDKNGTILTNPNKKLIYKNITSLNFKKEQYNKLFNKASYSFKAKINSYDSFITVHTSPSTELKIASVIPRGKLLADSNKIGTITIIVTLLIIFLAAIVSVFASKKITKPLLEMQSLMHLAGQGNLSIRASIDSNDEFQYLAIGFNDMINKLHLNNQELSSMNEELLATEDQLKLQYAQLTESEERYKLALDCSNDAIWKWELDTNYFFASSKFKEITGYSKEIHLNSDVLFRKYIHPDDKLKLKAELDNSIKYRNQYFKVEFRLKKADGSYVWLYCRGKSLADHNGQHIKLTGSIMDINDRKSSEEKINFLAFYDPLSKLPNRTFFMQKINEELLYAQKYQKDGALIFIDLDNFKNINDTMGHDCGDELLKTVSNELLNILRKEDAICRFGGDEFLILHPFKNGNDISEYVNSLLEIFDKSITINETKVYITASVGAALYPEDSCDAATLLKNADTAMYKSKEFGKNMFTLYNRKMYLNLERKNQIKNILINALINDELSVFLQPQYLTNNKELCSFEALLRLNSKELGFISPSEFIPIAEENGYIIKIGAWVFKQSCLKAVEWRRKGYKFNCIAVNVSAVQIYNPNFIDTIKSILEETKVSANDISIEITETVLIKSLDQNLSVLYELNNLGIKISLDDFGTGFSSLNYLRKIPISTLKVDKSFIDSIVEIKKDREVIKNIIQMAHDLNLIVIAEGVETKKQLLLLEELNCDIIQGYLFSKPLPFEDAETLMSC